MILLMAQEPVPEILVRVDLGVAGTLGTDNTQVSFNPMVTYWVINEAGFAVQAYWGGSTYLADPELN